MSTLVGKEAPDFTASAVLEDNNIETNFILRERLKNKIGVLFFYPLDFTFVCPSELIALSNKIKEFKERNVEVITISVDSHYTHLAYRKVPVEKGGVGDLKLTMVSDLSKDIAKNYGVLNGNNTVAFRAVFIIDKNFIVRHQLVNDLQLGRNINEILRILDALDHYEKHGEVCPANWQKGNVAMKPNAEGVQDYLSKHGSKL